MKYRIPLKLVELEAMNFHITITCKFADGREGLWVVDTGASKTVFDVALNGLYDLVETESDVEIQSAGIGAGKLATSIGQLHPLSFENFMIRDLQVALIDLSHINQLYFHVTEKEICGLIGSDFLHDCKAVIDYGLLELILVDDLSNKFTETSA